MVGKKGLRLGSALLVLAVCSGAMGAAIPVGTGGSHAGLYIEFADGANYTFDVAFDGPMTGMGLFDAVELATGLTTVRVYDAQFIDGITYDGHVSSGFGGGENWWHYWNREADTLWTSSYIGAGDRVIQDGSMDAWIYGRATAPLPEPATATLGLMTAALAVVRGRRVHGGNGRQ